MLTCFTAMVASFSGTSNRAGNAFGVVFLYLFVTFYASCFDACSYVYCSEIFPTNMRAQGVAASIFGQFSMTLLYTEVAATAFSTIGWKYYLVFIIVPACGLPFLARFPETRGLSLEEISAVFGDEVALDLTHMTTVEKTILDNELREGHGKTALEEFETIHKRHSVVGVGVGSEKIVGGFTAEVESV
jgi:MFS family permease